MSKINVCCVGIGTIGGGVSELLYKNKYKGISLYAICDKDDNKLNKLDFDVIRYNDFNDVLNDQNINLIVETMGGDEPAFTLIKKALEKGINVVSANKEVVAKHYQELSELLKKSKAKFLFEASVGGVVPIVNSIYNYQRANDIYKIEGIINGSTNYLLTLMQEDGIDYLDAIEDAKKRGFLESDPSSDLKGLDMKRKISILSDIAFHTNIDIDEVYNYSLEGVTDAFIEELELNDYYLKYMAEANKVGKTLQIRIEPVAVKINSLLAKIAYERNYIAFFGKTQEKVELLGLGAGRYPTSTAIISDIIQIASKSPKMDLNTKNKLKIDNSKLMDSYIIDGDIDNKLIDHKMGKLVVTKKISWMELNKNLSKINFYARIK